MRQPEPAAPKRRPGAGKVAIRLNVFGTAGHIGTVPSTAHHLAPALLHAYAAGDMDAVQRGAIERHLESCEECRTELARVSGMLRLFHQMQPRELDELKWRRIGNAVKAELEQDAIAHHHRLHADGKKSARWIAAGIAAAAGVMIALWFRPVPPQTTPQRPNALPPIASALDPATAGGAMRPGVYLHLSDDARIGAQTAAGNIDLNLEHGTLDVRSLEETEADPTIVVQTPAFRAVARSGDFTIGYRASGSFVEVRRGEVDLRDSPTGDTTVKRGERRVVTDSEPETPLPRVQRELERAIEKAKTAENAETRETGETGGTVENEEKPAPNAAAPVERSSSEGETTVSVEAPGGDALSKKWIEASEAFYRTRDLPRAIALAEEIVATRRARPEIALAEEMLCDAYISTNAAERAIAACSVTLARAENARQDERARAIHNQIATIYRTQLSDCARAMHHYGKAFVFGRASPFDDEAILWHAHCAIEQRDLDAAERDLVLLRRRSSSLARPGVLRELERRFEALEGSKAPASTPKTR